MSQVDRSAMIGRMLRAAQATRDLTGSDTRAADAARYEAHGLSVRETLDLVAWVMRRVKR
jgi:hypothetical protein